MRIPDSIIVDDADPDTFIDEALVEAVKVGASDVLITNNAAREMSRLLVIQARIDGTMRPFVAARGRNTGKVIEKVKTKLGIPPSGKFDPVDKTYDIMIDGMPHKARVAAFRTHTGADAINMRLPQVGGIRKLDELGISEENYERISTMLDKANGMVMLAGPMGSGKSSSAWAMLDYINDGTRAIWTVEDPVERGLDFEVTVPGDDGGSQVIKFPYAVQIEVDEESGTGFDKVLPSLVRADYNTLFLGEIRDQTTAKSGVRQANVGRQVFTTIHANDNITALLRLIELTEDSAIATLDAVRGVISQRLVATLNPEWDGTKRVPKYKGRTPVNEVLTVDDKIIEDFDEGKPLSRIREYAFESGCSTRFIDDAARLVDDGQTDWIEIARMLGRDTVEDHLGTTLDEAPRATPPKEPTKASEIPDF